MPRPPPEDIPRQLRRYLGLGLIVGLPWLAGCGPAKISRPAPRRESPRDRPRPLHARVPWHPFEGKPWISHLNLVDLDLLVSCMGKGSPNNDKIGSVVILENEEGWRAATGDVGRTLMRVK